MSEIHFCFDFAKIVIKTDTSIGSAPLGCGMWLQAQQMFNE